MQVALLIGQFPNLDIEELTEELGARSETGVLFAAICNSCIISWQAQPDNRSTSRARYATRNTGLAKPLGAGVHACTKRPDFMPKDTGRDASRFNHLSPMGRIA